MLSMQFLALLESLGMFLVFEPLSRKLARAELFFWKKPLFFEDMGISADTAAIMLNLADAPLSILDIFEDPLFFA